MASVRLLIRVALATLISNVVYAKVDEVPLPTIDLKEWWGPGSAPATEDTTITNFVIKFDPAMITDLQNRLSNHRALVPPLEGIAFEYGFNRNSLDLFMKFLAEQYPFADREKFLNQFQHYKTNIQGIDLHFMRVKSPDTTKEVVPLLILHGWPGSVREFYETIPFLLSNAQDKGFAFDIIAASLPGFAFSSGAVRPGMGVDKVAVVMRNLMHRLGYPKYFIQGGDMGSMVTSCMATFFSDEVLGYHTNFPFIHTPDMIFNLLWGNFHQDEIAEPQLLNRIYPSVDIFSTIVWRTGYLHVQATKPDSYGIGLSDSPSALMSHTLITTGTPNNTGTVSAIQLLDNYMIYWSTNCATTAMRLYAGTFNKRYVGLRINEIRTPVPTRVLQAPNEIMYLPPWMIKQKFVNLLGETLPATGGHFFAWQMPKEFADDVVDSIIAFKNWHTMNDTMYTQCSSYIHD